MDIRSEVLSLKRQHYYCEDRWYSCPQHPEGCANNSNGPECYCGATEENERIDEIVKELDAFVDNIKNIRDDIGAGYDTPWTDRINVCLKRITT